MQSIELPLYYSTVQIIQMLKFTFQGWNLHSNQYIHSYTTLHTDPATIQLFLTTNFAALTGRSVTSNDLTSDYSGQINQLSYHTIIMITSDLCFMIPHVNVSIIQAC